jgi:FtsH-binding integral membrane protein
MSTPHTSDCLPNTSVPVGGESGFCAAGAAGAAVGTAAGTVVATIAAAAAVVGTLAGFAASFSEEAHAATSRLAMAIKLIKLTIFFMVDLPPDGAHKVILPSAITLWDQPYMTHSFLELPNSISEITS